MLSNVGKSELLTILKTNRDGHKALYEEAFENYKKEAVKELEGYLEQVKAGRVVRIYSSLPIPEDHTEDYDAVIKLLEMSLDERISLDDSDTRRYVLDRWEWERTFAANTLRYTSKGS